MMVLGSGTDGSPIGGVDALVVEVNSANAVSTKAAPNILTNTDFILDLLVIVNPLQPLPHSQF
jgi:hypothetical protein